MNFLLLLLAAGAHAALLLNEDFSCASLGCNETAQPTNYSLWRWSTTGSAQAYMHLANATDTARGTAVHSTSSIATRQASRSFCGVC